jgi:hypothetical protein
VAQKKKKTYLLELKDVLLQLDLGNRNFYADLTPEQKKAYAPVVLMRYMSSLGDQNSNSAYSVVMVNALVNIGFWQLTKNHTELQHLLLCITGLKKKQYRPWLKAGGRKSQSKIVDDFLREIYPGANIDELNLVKSTLDNATFKDLCHAAGKSDQQIKELMENWKKLDRDD